MRADLVDRRESAPKSVARRAQVDRPDAHMLLTRKPNGVLGTILQAREPVCQALSVIGGESLEVPGGEASTLERCEDPRGRSGAASGNT
jgi:hypothetical protein